MTSPLHFRPEQFIPAKPRERYEKKIRRYGALCRLAYGLPDDLTLSRWTDVMMFGRGSDNYLDINPDLSPKTRIDRYFEYLDNDVFADIYPSISLRSLGCERFEEMVKSIKTTVTASENSKQATSINMHTRYRIIEGLGTANVVLATASDQTRQRRLFPRFAQHFRFGGVLNTLNDSTIDFWNDTRTGNSPLKFNLSYQLELVGRQLAWSLSLAKIAMRKRPTTRG